MIHTDKLGVDIDVAPGELVAFLGPNGAGKSTTLRTKSKNTAAVSWETQASGVAAQSTRARSTNETSRPACARINRPAPTKSLACKRFGPTPRARA